VDREISPTVMWGGIALAVVLLLLIGVFINNRNQPHLTPDEEQKLNRTMTLQYQQYWGAGGPRGARGR
jgi:hypothetical protein